MFRITHQTSENGVQKRQDAQTLKVVEVALRHRETAAVLNNRGFLLRNCSA